MEMASPESLCVTSKGEYREYTKARCRAAKYLLSIRAPASDEKKRAPVSVSLVLDRSGSMAGTKLKTAKSTLHFLLSQLLPDDQVGVVTYDDQVAVPVELKHASNEYKMVANSAIMCINDGGCTNLSGGLFKGLEQQLPGRESREWQVIGSEKGDPALESATPIKAVFLFTDGLANRGLTNSDQIVDSLKKLMASGGPVSKPSALSTLKSMVGIKGKPEKVESNTLADIKVHTFGFGADHDPRMLQAIAEAANGTYYYIEKTDDIPAAFADALGGLMSVSAQNINIILRPAAPGVVINKVHTGFATSTNGDEVSISMSDIYAEEQKDIILELDLPEATDEGPEHVLMTTVTYMDVTRGQLQTLELDVFATRVTDISEEMTPDEEVTAHWSRIEAAAAIVKARESAERGEMEQARQLLLAAKQSNRETAGCLKKSKKNKMMHHPGEAPSEDAPEEACKYSAMLDSLNEDLEQLEVTFASRKQYLDEGQKYAYTSAQSHMHQRSKGGVFAPATSSSCPLGGPSQALCNKPAANPAMYSNQVQQRMTMQSRSVFEPSQPSQPSLAAFPLSPSICEAAPVVPENPSPDLRTALDSVMTSENCSPAHSPTAVPSGMHANTAGLAAPVFNA